MLIKRKKLQDSPEPEQKVVTTRPTINFIDNQQYIEQAENQLENQIKLLWNKTNSEIEQAKTDAENQAASIIQSAKQESQAIIHNAEQQAQQILSEVTNLKATIEAEKTQLAEDIAKEKAKAFEDGINQAQKHIDEIISALKNFNQAEKKLVEYIKGQIATIGFDVAKLILGESLIKDDNIINTQVKRALDKIIDCKGVVQIYINEADQENIKAIKLELAEILDDDVRILINTDNQISPGSCQVNTQAGRLDANFATQLSTIKVILEKHLGYKIDELENSKLLVETNMTNEKAKKNSKSKKKINISEPSDLDLEIIESEEDQMIDLVLDQDLDSLLEEIVPSKKESKKIEEKIEDDDEDIIEFDWEDDDEDEVEEDSADDLGVKDAKEIFEDFEDLADLEETEDGFSDSEDDGDYSDPRYPEY